MDPYPRATVVRDPVPGATTKSGRPDKGLLALTVVVIALQIAWPLTDGVARQHVTAAIVVGFALACLLHVAVTRGPARAAIVFAVTAVPGFLVEVLGVHTGFPFGSYGYADMFGPRLFDVPLVIGLAWTMMCWPAALAARRLVSGRLARVLLGAWATTAGDLFLDPQLVSTGAWRWQHPSPHLPGVPDVPLSNYAGWLLATLALSALLQAVIGRDGGDVDDGGSTDTYGVGLFLWSWVSWTVALAVFLDQPAAAAWGFVAMGTVAIPLLRSGAGRDVVVAARRFLISTTNR